MTPQAEQAGAKDEAQQPQKAAAQHQDQHETSSNRESTSNSEGSSVENTNLPHSAGKHAGLATPAVRGLLKELNIDISKVPGTGKDGRVLKEDVHNYAASLKSTSPFPKAPSNTEQNEESIKLTPIQSQMFKTMTRSLLIPHFLYADETDMTALAALRKRLNTSPSPSENRKLAYLPFIIKAVSLALNDFPLLNARIDTSTDIPRIIMRSLHNIGIAMDTPQGLIVPNIKNVQSHSIASLAAEISRLQTLARAGSLSANDLPGGTITVSNSGSIGGTVVSPIIANANEVAILGVGKVRSVPKFDEQGQVVKREVCNLCWSADHRVVDGATLARMGERVRGFLEEPGRMMLGMR